MSSTRNPESRECLSRTRGSETHILQPALRNPAAVVEPGFPSMISNDQPVIVPTATSSGRRTALANWIADPRNPLTARVMVNRIWYQNFAHGIVDSVSDFGKMGEKPTNPELLDWLASEFVQQGWSIKKLEREIMLSSVYRQASAHREDASAVDPTTTASSSRACAWMARRFAIPC